MPFDSNIYADKISKIKGKKELLNKKLDTAKSNLDKLNESIVYLEKAQAFIQQVAKDTQEQIRFVISDIVNLALDTCFPNRYTFQVNFEIKRGKTEAALCFLKDNIEIDPMEASGGGAVDLASFALRIAVWSLGKSDNTIILDEPFKWLQPRELNRKGLEMIKQLSQKLGLQFIIVSNSVQGADIADISDKVFEVSLKKGISKIIEKE